MFNKTKLQQSAAAFSLIAQALRHPPFWVQQAITGDPPLTDAVRPHRSLTCNAKGSEKRKVIVEVDTTHFDVGCSQSINHDRLGGMPQLRRAYLSTSEAEAARQAHADRAHADTRVV
eukprot:4905-Heterococcus_DN1.PRE.5